MKFNKIGTSKNLAEQLAESITEAILAGELKAGESLPTEPILAEQFSVSRSVVRDAVKMVAAKGLVEVRHGTGTFVTNSSTPAFGDAMLLALKREGGTAWDVEEVFLMLYPEIFSQAAQRISDDGIAALREAAMTYLDIVKNSSENSQRDDGFEPEMRASFRNILMTIADATGNSLTGILSSVLFDLRNFREIIPESNQTETELSQNLYELEREVINTWIEGIASRNPAIAKEAFLRYSVLSEDVIAAFKQTPAGSKVPIASRIFLASMEQAK